MTTPQVTFSKLSLILIFLLSSYQAFAGLECLRFFSPDDSQLIDHYLTKKYPELSFLTENVDSFITEQKQRFEEYKKIDPKNPHGFDYTEVGMPPVKYAADALIKKIENIEAFKIVLETKIKSKNVFTMMFRKRLKIKLAEVETGLKFLNELKKESEEIISSGKVSYRQSIEFLYFFSRANGYFDARQFSFRSRAFLAIDRAFQGYKQLPIEREYHMYKTRSFSIFQKTSTVKAFEKAEMPFESAFLNKDELKTIVVPSAVAIDRDILMRLMPKNVNIVGVIAEPLAADGFLRPSGDFWMHDVRHESAKYRRRLIYQEKKMATEEQMVKIDDLQEKWLLELHNELIDVKDNNLREAIELLAFNYNHDRGFPVVPSAWLTRKNGHVMYSLLFMLTVSGQGTGFWFPITNTVRATKWLDDFWKKRAHIEDEILSTTSKITD